MTMAKQPGRVVRRALAAAGALAAAALVAACGSAPPDRFYTLAGEPPTAGGAAAPAALPTSSAFYIEVMPVNVPQQVARDQIVITTGPGQVDLLEHRRWIAPLSDEIGRALSDDLSRTLGAIDVYRAPRVATQPVYRISVNVRRFESVPGTRASVGATWSVRQLPGGALVTCRSDITEPVGAGYDALVAGHRQALARLSADIATAVRNLGQRGGATAGASAVSSVGRTATSGGSGRDTGAGGAANAIDPAALDPAAICPATS